MSQQSAQNPIGSPFIELQSVDSTNNYARTQIHADLARHGMALFAHHQTAGKGQRGKSWQSQKGENIALSVLLNPQPLNLQQQFQLSACVAVAVLDFFCKYAGDDTTIKWPNDIYWQDRKAGGILIESVIGSSSPANGDPLSDMPGIQGQGQWKWAIAGMGININQVIFSPDLPNPVSLKQITGKTFSPLLLASELCEALEEKYRLLISEGFSGIYHQYASHLYKKGKTARLKKGSRVYEAIIKNVLPDGRLLTEHGTEEILDFGAVEWVI